MQNKNVVMILILTSSSVVISGLLILGPYGIDFFEINPENDLSSFNVSLTIDYNGHIPTFGPIDFIANSSDTVLDLLKRVTSVETKNYATEIFVTSINSTSNNQDGNQLFWQFWVNGVYANLGAGRFTLSSNDFIEWKYTGQ